MKYKVGDKVRVKKGCESVCGAHGKEPSDYLVITEPKGISGYRYDIYRGGERVDYCFNCFKDEHLEPLEKTWDNLAKGDILVDGNGKDGVVIEVLGDIVFFNYNNSFDKVTGYHTKKTLKELGYTIKQPEPETVEVTMDEVAKALKVDVKNLKIKK